MQALVSVNPRMHRHHTATATDNEREAEESWRGEAWG